MTKQRYQEKRFRGCKYTTDLKLHSRQFSHYVPGRVSDLCKGDIALRHALDSGVVEGNKVTQHCGCLVERTEPIVNAHSVLL